MLRDLVRAAIPPSLHPNNLARRRIMRYSDGKVAAGPFAGMIYLTQDDDFIEPGMLVGTYEKELYQYLEKVLSFPPELFIDIGAAQGYFAVGLALRAPHAKHIAFEMHSPRVEQLKRTATANKVEINIKGECTTDSLNSVLSGSESVFILSDIEGYEAELIDPTKSPGLKRATMIVELHNGEFGPTPDIIKNRFSKTHFVEEVQMLARTTADLPFLIKDRWTVRQLNEGRSNAMGWVFMRPR